MQGLPHDKCFPRDPAREYAEQELPRAEQGQQGEGAAWALLAVSPRHQPSSARHCASSAAAVDHECILPVWEILCNVLWPGLSQLNNVSVKKTPPSLFNSDKVWQELKALEIRSSKPFSSKLASGYPKESPWLSGKKHVNGSQQLCAKPVIPGVVKPDHIVRALGPP